MKKEIIEQLLERYWQGNTSIEEEKQLLEFFSGNKVPEELKKYIPLFQLKSKNRNIKPNSHLEPFPFQEKRTLVSFYSIIKVAASFLLIITIGIGVYTHYQQERFLDAVFSETYSEPGDAVKHTGEIMAKVSSLQQLVPETSLQEEESDSIEIKKLKKIEILNDSLKLKNSRYY